MAARLVFPMSVYIFITLYLLCTAFVNGGRVPNFEDSIMCGGSNGLTCHGHGSCNGGVCTCDPGYTGRTCGDADSQEKMTTQAAITMAPEKTTVIACDEADVAACSNHGRCVDGTCLCDQDVTGLLCEMTSAGFCNVYDECAECAAFGEACPKNCTIFGSFQVILDLPTDESSHMFHRCRARSQRHQCNFQFQLKDRQSNGQMTILVKPCRDPDVGDRVDPASTTNDEDEQGKAGNQAKAAGDNSDSLGSHFEPQCILLLIAAILASRKRQF